MDKRSASSETYHHTNLVSWRSILAGLLFATLCYFVMTALGAGIGGVAASRVINNENGGMGLARGVVLWLGITAAISLFLGSYFAVRLSRFVTDKVGMAHGLLLSSLFFLFMMWGLGAGVEGTLGGLTKAAFSATGGATSLAESPMVQDSIQRAIGTSNLKSDPSTVAQGLMVRLAQGNVNSAKEYLANQTGQTPAEIEVVIGQLRNDFEQNVKAIGDQTARGVSAAGWGLFVALLVGILGAALGGYAGARANQERPIAQLSIDPIYRNEMAKV